ncbi:hypothetical protein [Vibrio phage vB_VmeM-Yong XC32]|nr:hypothetical protein [Vibrio phage vB_VmeM-Yong XC31]QAX96606.1 hypothetical protein [Vibrio phage vB_VmeM-Yong XC32]QAX96924.1 hypothetical protein [Vibrio phage vB_VmeM-Yong MS31]QAX97229.1 hypothetical protein [Vibrio phage vB_VmeM-Yong MS32]
MDQEYLTEIANGLNGALKAKEDIFGFRITSGRYFISPISAVETIKNRDKNDEYANQLYISGRTKYAGAVMPVYELESDEVDIGYFFFSTIDGYDEVSLLRAREHSVIDRDALVFGDIDEFDSWQMVEFEEDFDQFRIYEVRGAVEYSDGTSTLNAVIGYAYQYIGLK